MQPMYNQPVSLSAQMSVSAPLTDPAHASLTSSQMHCITPGYPLQVGDSTFSSPLQAVHTDKERPIWKSVGYDMADMCMAQYQGKASMCVKLQICATSDGLSVQNDGKQDTSYLGGQAAYAASGGFSDAHQQQFNLQPQHQQQERVFNTIPSAIYMKCPQKLVSCYLAHRHFKDFKYGKVKHVQHAH